MLLPQKATSPLLLTASVYLNPGAQSNPNTIALKNPMGAPMEILELRWQVFSGVPASGTNSSGTLGGSVGCKLDVGTIPLTNGFVPVWLFGRELNNVDAVQYDTANLVNPYTSQTILESYTNFYSWRLPKPLYVPAGAVITPAFQHFGAIRNPINVIVTARARSLPIDAPPPKTISYPWAASYLSNGYIAGTEVNSEQSDETDLINPFDQPIHLQRMGGRILVVDQSGDPVFDWTYPQIASSQFTVRMSDSFGRQIVRDFTSMSQSFATLSRGWELNNGTVMDPKSYYIVYLNKGLGGFDSEIPASINCQAQISLVGWRDMVGGGAR